MDRDVSRLMELFRERGAILYGDFTFASGVKSKNKIDAEPVLKDAEGAELVGRLVGNKILELEKEHGTNCEIAGVYWGGARVAELAANYLGRKCVSLNHKKGEVMGDLRPAEYIVCEDVTTKASSIIKCLEQFVRPKNAIVKNTVTIVDRTEGAVENLANLGIRHHYFFTKGQLGVKS